MQGIAGNLRIVPVDGEGNWRVAEDAEVESVVRVLPDVFAADDDALAECLFQACVKFVAEARLLGRRDTGRAIEQRRQDGAGAAGTRQHQVFVEGRLKGAGIGDAQHGRAGLDVVGNSQPGLGLPGSGEPVVEVLAKTEVEEPVSGLDLVFEVERSLFHVGAAIKGIQATAARQVIRGEYRLVIRVREDSARSALRWIGVSGQRIAAHIHARRVVDGLYDAEFVVLAQECVGELRRRP